MLGFSSSLRSRIRLVAFGILTLGIALDAYAMPKILELGRATQTVLQMNYISIQAGMHMHGAIHRLQVAELRGHAHSELGDAQDEFTHWMDVENHAITEVGEAELAHDIETRAGRLFLAIASASPASRHDTEFDQLNLRADDLIAMNQAAMFRDDAHARRLSAWLAYSFGVGLLLVAVLGITLSWTLSRTIARPLERLAQLLRGVSGREFHPRLEPQGLLELNTVALEFNQMAERLEYYDRMNLEQLLFEKSKIEAVVESLEDGVVLLDSEDRVVHINGNATLIMGIEQNALLGEPFESLTGEHPRYARVCRALREARQENGKMLPVEVTFDFRGRDHTYILKSIKLKETSRPLGKLLVLQDITYLRDQDRSRANLFGNLSHELRTPLTSLALSAELLRNEDSALSAEQRKALLERVFDESRRMKQLTLNLLDISRGHLPPSSLRRVPVQLSAIIEDVMRRFDVQAQTKQINLRASIDTATEVQGDPEKLFWVLSNLVGNALRYTPETGSVEIAMRSEAGNPTVRVEVADTGPGIPQELRSAIFERFVQYEADGRNGGSVGLGLAIVKEIVEEHGGTVSVEQNDGKGAKFIVQLPTFQSIVRSPRTEA